MRFNPQPHALLKPTRSGESCSVTPEHEPLGDFYPVVFNDGHVGIAHISELTPEPSRTDRTCSYCHIPYRSGAAPLCPTFNQQATCADLYHDEPVR